MKKKKIIVFLPAFNEENSIGAVIQSIPRNIRPDIEVKVLVIDDGSKDKTVQVSKKAGADWIVSFPENKGLGAAVRAGLQECVKREAHIGVMIDADGEYPARQIPDLIAPLLSGEADYTMGSRFMGTIKGMKVHRRLGNYFFTGVQSVLLRTWIWDGQSGMRAFTRYTMECAEIIHDYNYAQVLTLNLVRKRFRMKEVPITYQVRTTGESFIKFKKYMTAVLPAIWKEWRRPVSHFCIQDSNKEKTHAIKGNHLDIHNDNHYHLFEGDKH